MESQNNLIRAITLKSGPQGLSSSLTLRPGSVTVFIGPNHSGKSRILQEINEAVPKESTIRFSKVLQGLEFNPIDALSRAGFQSEIRIQCRQFEKDGVPHIELFNEAHRIMLLSEFEDVLGQFATVEGMRAQFGHVGHNLANKLCLHLNGGKRLDILNATTRENLSGKMGTTLGILFQDDAKRGEVQRIVRQAFGWHLLIDVTGKDNFRAVISETKPPVGVERSISNEALNFLRKCDEITTMSDGVRAYCGMIAAVTASEAKVVLLDEPEAFLHPALCNSLANELCRKARETGRQLIIATHSASFLLGCVQAAVDLNIVRLTYRSGLATSRVLENKEIVPLMRNPLLRSIGALNGVFFESVVVTEAETDRAFYEEVNNRCLAFRNENGIQDCLFLNAQNWQTTRIIGPLRKLGIPAAAVVDIDLVCEEAGASFQSLLEAAGIPEHSRVSMGQLRGRLRPQTDEGKKNLKARGIEALSGDARQSLEDFIEQLANYGVFIVPCGEVEGWLPNLKRASAYKSVWLENTFEVMGEDATLETYVKPADDDVWNFFGKIKHWLHDPNRRGVSNTSAA